MTMPSNGSCARRSFRAILYIGQFLATIALIIAIGDSLLRAAVVAVFWLITFYPRGSRREFAFFVITSIVFTVANFGALRTGTFLFHHPDVILMPWNELGMWGFYCLNARRVIDPPASTPSRMEFRAAIALAALFAVSFSVVQNEKSLALLLLLIFAAAMRLFHTKSDIKFVFYFGFMGLVVEVYGLALNFWSYPRAHFFEWPLWGPFMWLNIGWIIARIGTLFFPHGRDLARPYDCKYKEICCDRNSRWTKGWGAAGRLLREIINVFVIAAEFLGIHPVADDEPVFDGHADVIGPDGQFTARGLIEKRHDL